MQRAVNTISGTAEILLRFRMHCQEFLSSYTSSNQSALRGYSNEEYDKLYDEAIASPTIEERKANYFEVEKFFCDNTLNLILGWADGGFQYKSGYTGFYNTVETDFTYLDFAE